MSKNEIDRLDLENIGGSKEGTSPVARAHENSGARRNALDVSEAPECVNDGDRICPAWHRLADRVYTVALHQLDQRRELRLHSFSFVGDIRGQLSDRAAQRRSCLYVLWRAPGLHRRMRSWILSGRAGFYV